MKLTIIALLLIALSIFPGLALDREIYGQDQNESAVLRIEQAWVRELVERDRATLERILAEDFVDSSWKGELRSKREVLADLDKPRPYTQHLRDMKIQLH
jgi:hypothetical protein